MEPATGWASGYRPRRALRALCDITKRAVLEQRQKKWRFKVKSVKVNWFSDTDYWQKPSGKWILHHLGLDVGEVEPSVINGKSGRWIKVIDGFSNTSVVFENVVSQYFFLFCFYARFTFTLYEWNFFPTFSLLV